MPANIPYSEQPEDVRQALILRDILQGKAPIDPTSIVRPKGTHPLRLETKPIHRRRGFHIVESDFFTEIREALDEYIWEGKSEPMMFHVVTGRGTVEGETVSTTPVSVLIDVPDTIRAAPERLNDMFMQMPMFPDSTWVRRNGFGYTPDAHRIKWFMDNVTDVMDPLVLMKFDSQVSQKDWVSVRRINGTTVELTTLVDQMQIKPKCDDGFVEVMDVT
ncbi:hypothetical protein BJX70DRAFT_395334 [Aspergillus crustosus]